MNPSNQNRPSFASTQAPSLTRVNRPAVIDQHQHQTIRFLPSSEYQYTTRNKTNTDQPAANRHLGDRFTTDEPIQLAANRHPKRCSALNKVELAEQTNPDATHRLNLHANSLTGTQAGTREHDMYVIGWASYCYY